VEKLGLGCFCVLCFILGFSVKVKLTVPLLCVCICILPGKAISEMTYSVVCRVSLDDCLEDNREDY